MAIRTNTNPRQMDLQPETRDMLMRSGLQAHVALSDAGYRLIVRGHDSPLLVCPITERQMLALTDWGTNTANRKAYNVLTSIVGKDFYMPKNFIHARNTNGRVAMGLHGYRIVIGEYGRMGRMGVPPPFLGWTPRNQLGFHLRRVGGQLFFPGPSIIPECPDGHMKPDELQSGGYGFYYKGHQQEQPVQQRDVPQSLQATITPMISRPRSKEPARPYKELVASSVCFSSEEWAECPASHSLVVDAEKQTLTVQSESVQVDMVYGLAEEEVRTLVVAPIEEQPVKKRLELLNGIIGADFSDKVTTEALNSDQRIATGLHLEVQQSLKQHQRQEQEAFMPVKTSLQQQEESVQGNIGAVMDGCDLQFLNESKGWYREEKHGREVEMSQVAVQPTQTEGKCRMTAVIDGRAISHEITQRDYDKFLAVDDYHWTKLFSKTFSKVDMKIRPETQQGLGTKIFATLTAGTVVAAGAAYDIHHHYHAPEFYNECFGGLLHPYSKPGVDTPRDVAIRCFEAEMNREINDMRMGRQTMREGGLTYDGFLRRLNIQDVLIDAGYHLNWRDGLRYPSYVRLDSEGRRIRNDKLIVTQQGKCCFKPQQQKSYNTISFIKEHPHFFVEYHAGVSPDRLVDLVCNRLLNHPVADRDTRIIQSKRDMGPLDIADYGIHQFNPQDRVTQKKFYPFFEHRGIDLYMQYAFHRNFYLAARHHEGSMKYTNLAFLLAVPKDTGQVVGLEERGRPRMDGSGSYKGKVEGSNSSQGLWTTSPAKTTLTEAKHIYWFENAYDMMAYYQLHQADDKDLRKAVFISTGGNPTVGQMRGVLTLSFPAKQHICFDTGLTRIEFAKSLQQEMYRTVHSTIEETPKRKPYLDPVADGENLDKGDIDLLPDALRSNYGKYGSAQGEAMSMRSSGLCHPDDIREQTDIMNGNYKELHKELREFLGLDKANDASFIREQPTYPNKDWNEQLLTGQKQEETVDETQARKQSPEGEQQTHFRR